MLQPDETTGRDAATPQQRCAMRSAIIAQCFGALAYIVMTRGLMLVYLTRLGIPSLRILVYLSLPEFLRAAIHIPCAIIADRKGIKRVGVPGLILTSVGFAGLSLAPLAPSLWVEPGVALGIAVFAIGATMMEAGWLSILSPIVPTAMRGRFFGRLRMSWQTAGMIYVGACAVVLKWDDSISTYQYLMAVATFGLIVRIVYYARMPELEAIPKHPVAVRAALGEIIRAPGYASFCAYVMLLGLCTGAVFNLFGLVEKDVLELSDTRVVWLGNMTLIGSVLGFLIGGRTVDRYSTRPVFLVCHFGYATVLVLFLVRHLAGDALLFALVTVHLLLGILIAASSIAISTELLALIPAANKSLSTSLAGMMLRMSAAVSGLIAAWVLEQGILTDSWTLGSAIFSNYDSILLLFAVMVLLFVVTLGLVPSVIRKAEWVPGRG